MAEDVFGIVGSVIASAYHVESVVAEGGFGVVYRAHHGGFRAPVALKLLKVPQQDPQQQQAFLELFRSEAELLFRLSASLPAVVRALHVDSFTSKDGRFVPYLVLEWLDGLTLEALIAQRREASMPPVSLRKLVRLLTPVARALERAHNFSGPEGQISLVHRDLKPENIFIAQVAGEEVVKILDFGIGKVKGVASQVAGRMSQDGGAPTAFTPAYGAPEQWAPRHYGQTGPWTDVWGLALCLVEVMLGRTAIAGDPATMMGIALDPQRRPTPRSEGIDVPDAVEAVFARALALDPRARQKHAGIFWNELVAALEQPVIVSTARSIEVAEDLEFDPSSIRKPASIRASAPYSVPLSAPSRASAAPRPGAPAPGPAIRAVAAQIQHIVPDLELTPPPVSRRHSGEHPVAQPQPNLIDFDSASLPTALDLDLVAPAGEARGPRIEAEPNAQQTLERRSNPPPHTGAMPAQGEPLLSSPTSGVMSTRNSAPPLSLGQPARTTRSSRPPISADVSAPFEAGFVAKIDPKSLEERSLMQRLRPSMALLGAAILVAVFDPIYAATTGEVVEILGQRLSLFAGALLLLALGLGVRELIREQ
ncbi:MAG TPA: serine/threonine-protein kinase [Polyangiaceae bacterium]|nr:serine/threonine-protein kinase [Polyangiaceae bacterium]